MTLDKLLSYLRQHDVYLRMEGDRLQYQGPQEVMTPEFVEHLRQNKAQLIRLLREANDDSQPARPAIDSIRRPADNLPLAFAQQPLWFLHKLQSENVSDHLHVGVRIKGQLQIDALKRSLDEIVKRHEVLHTIFPEVNGKPVQVIQPELFLDMKTVNFQNIPKTEWEKEIQRIASEASREPFSLAQGPLWRVKLLHLRDDEHIFLVIVHHIIADGWSFDLFYRELSQLYEAFISGRPSPLEELPVQYADYACWQRQWMQDKTLESLVAYWKNQLAGSSLVLELPADRTRPAVLSYQGAKRFIEFSSDIFEDLKALSQRVGCTVFMVLVAAFQTILYRYTEKDDIIVGVPVANRDLPELQKLMGLFLNMVVLRTDLSGNPGFRSLLARVRKVTLDAFAHKDLPFEKLVEVLRPERDLSRNPLFQVMFQYSPQGCLKLPGLSVEAINFDSGTAQFDLSLHLYDNEAGLRGFFEYNTDLFDASTIDRMAGHFQTLLEGIVANPECELSNLPLLTATEKHQLLVEWNDTDADYPRQACLHQLFEEQVARTPDRVAVVYEENRLTYTELNRRANQLAHHLQKLGVGPDVLVGICVERSLDMMVVLLGVLKAGGAYVPLDPTFPAERLALMLEDAQVAVLITQRDLVNILPEIQGNMIFKDHDWHQIAPEPQNNPVSEVTADHLAYVIYTSGSTGKPKGVQLPHAAVVNFLLSMAKEPGLTEKDILLAVTTLSFDIAVLELFLPIIVGARVVIVSSEVAADGIELSKELIRSTATVIQATPASYRMLIAAGWQGSDDLKILCGGEALPRDLADQLLERSHSLWNMYGPTETTIWSTLDEIKSKVGPILIGFPIANTRLYILDRQLQPVPVGVPGELHIGGDGLARGYLNRPNLTAERFIADPFSDVPGSRIYKTGDQARYRPDGNIEVMGRLDFQVKVRGFRIELGDIEAALQQHPEVRQAVTVVREDTLGNKQLAAYLISNQSPAPSVGKLRSFLTGKLPEYMVPSVFFALDAFPLTPNGKVDRKALPAPTGLRPDLEHAYVAPGNELEQILTAIWQNVLKIEKIGVNDNFFDLGGHSLLAVRLFAQIGKKLDINLPLATLYQAPTIKLLANILGQKDWKPDWSSLVAIQANGSKPPLFLIHAAQGNVLLYRELALYLGPNQPVYGLQSQYLNGQTDTHTRVQNMAAHYIEDIRTVQPEGPYYLGGYCLGGGIALEIAQQLYAQGQKVALLVMFETYNLQFNPQALSSIYRPYRWFQLMKFQIENLLQLRPYERLVYFMKKVRVQKTRIKFRVNVSLSKIASVLTKTNGSRYPHVNITKLNDRAFEEYVPEVYPGRLTLFRPRKNFLGLDNPHFGWAGLAAGGLDIHKFRVCPRGMLVEPFVQMVSDKLKQCIKEAESGIKN